MFAAYKDKLPGFKKTDTISSIPASDRFGTNSPGQWFVSRHEVLPRTEILLQYTTRKATGFQEETEHLLLICDPDAPLYRIRLDLPMHELSSVPNVFFEGRFYLVSDDEQLSPEAIAAWRKHLAHMDEDYQLADILDAAMPPEDRKYHPIMLEREIKPLAKQIIKTTTKGSITKIRRSRTIRTR
jgi:hypothetical protein